MEAELKLIKEQCTGLEDRMEKFKDKETDIDVSIDTITKTKEFISNLEKRTDILKDSFNEIKGIEEDLKKRVSIVDEKTTSLIGNEEKINEVLSRFKEMDSLIIDIEARTKQLQNTREWLARTESRLTSLAQDAERLTGELKNLIEKQENNRPGGIAGQSSKERPGALSREAESKVKTVLTLFDQKWTIPEICKVTKMSRGEVELILELNHRD